MDTLMGEAVATHGPPFCQVAYFVPDVGAAALRHRALFGSGPCFVAGRIPLRLARHSVEIHQPAPTVTDFHVLVARSASAASEATPISDIRFG